MHGNNFHIGHAPQFDDLITIAMHISYVETRYNIINTKSKEKA